MPDNSVVLMGCGDIGPVHEPMELYSKLVQPTLASADVRFAQCERVYSERGSLQIHSNGHHSRLKPAMASIFSDCGIDVVSMASNHAMDWGEDALLDTIALFREKGIQAIGAGRNLQEARRPAVVERNGMRIAILAYCSILHEGYAARVDRAGVAPLRAHTYYEPTEYQAGASPKVVTILYQEDLAAMVEDIIEAKKTADVVVLSLHWGIHYTPRTIADYQPVLAEEAFAAGASLILGHHAHVPKAIGVHNGKICFYSLSNFIMSAPEKTPAQQRAFSKRFGVTMVLRSALV